MEEKKLEAAIKEIFTKLQYSWLARSAQQRGFGFDSRAKWKWIVSLL